MVLRLLCITVALCNDHLCERNFGTGIAIPIDGDPKKAKRIDQPWLASGSSKPIDRQKCQRACGHRTSVCNLHKGRGAACKYRYLDMVRPTILTAKREVGCLVIKVYCNEHAIKVFIIYHMIVPVLTVRS